MEGAAHARLGAARVTVVGAGALGSAAAAQLACAGVGELGLVDRADVNPDERPRELLHWTPDAGGMKVESAAAKLALLAPETQVDSYPVELESMNATAIVAGSDVVVDCSGSSATRLLVNEACCAERIELVAASRDGREGRITAVRPGVSPCLACSDALDPPEAKGASVRGSEAGDGAMAGVLGAAQALEALKLLTGAGEPLLGRLLLLHGGSATVEERPLRRSPGCPACAGLAAQPQSA